MNMISNFFYKNVMFKNDFYFVNVYYKNVQKLYIHIFINFLK